MAQKQTPLQAAIGGETAKLSDKQARGALSQAVSKLTNMTRRAEISKEAVTTTGTALLHTAETMGSLFLSSMVEGYVGPERMRVGGVDLRAPVGLLSQGYGFYQLLSGDASGAHALALGNGVTGSWLASVGSDAGRALRERRQPPGQSAPPQTHSSFRGVEPLIHIPAMNGPLPQPRPQPVYHQLNLTPEPVARVAGPAREILLTPEQEQPDELAGPGQRIRQLMRQRQGNRFPRATEEADEQE